MPLRSKVCEAEGCDTEIVFLKKADGSGGAVPVDLDSLNGDEDETTQFSSKAGHVSHYKTCKDPNRFSGRNQPAKPKAGYARLKIPLKAFEVENDDGVGNLSDITFELVVVGREIRLGVFGVKGVLGRVQLAEYRDEAKTIEVK